MGTDIMLNLRTIINDLARTIQHDQWSSDTIENTITIKCYSQCYWQQQKQNEKQSKIQKSNKKQHNHNVKE